MFAVKRLVLTCVLGGACAVAYAVPSVPIAGLFNTGAGNLNNLNAVDTNYAFRSFGTAIGTDCGSDSGKCGVVANDGGWPIGPWIANSQDSAWLAPSATQAQSYDPSSNGNYTWTLKFDLTGFDPATASFKGRFAADNGSTVKLNTTVLATTTSSFSDWTSFAASSSSFLAGWNYLTFTVVNFQQDGGNPTGLRAEFLGSSVSAIPEPASYALMLCGLLAVAGAARRRSRG